ncbi:hypothetical protein ACFL6C_14750 [Myxococcota bacterium]
MKTPASIPDLSKQIEQVVEDYLAASQRAAAAALERAFATAPFVFREEHAAPATGGDHRSRGTALPGGVCQARRSHGGVRR